MSAPVIVVLSFLLSVAAIRLTLPLAYFINALDHPGGHKGHGKATPFTGGVGIAAALLLFLLFGISTQVLPETPWLAMMSATAGIFVVGFLDDLWQLDYRVRFVTQSFVALAMALGAGVSASSLGELFPGIVVELGWLGIPFTVFATIGGINALNMIDGADGLSGMVSLVSLTLLAAVAVVAQEQFYFLVILAILGGVGGFLFFNLRFGKWDRARVFLGDNGSMLLGFVFVWLFFGLSQGPHPAMTPVTALYLFAVPLYDTLAVMIRRIWMRRSPFHGDRHHLHHLLQRAGARVSDAVVAIALVQLVMGTLGLVGLYRGVPEWVMFFLYLVGFAIYTFALVRPWRFIPLLRRVLLTAGFTLEHCRGIYVGRFSSTQEELIASWIDAALGDSCPYAVYRQPIPSQADLTLFAFVDTNNEREAKRAIRRLRRYKPASFDLAVRQYLNRDTSNNRRIQNQAVANERRMFERRAHYPLTLIKTYEPGAASTVVTA